MKSFMIAVIAIEITARAFILYCLHEVEPYLAVALLAYWLKELFSQHVYKAAINKFNEDQIAKINKALKEKKNEKRDQKDFK